MKKVLVGMVIGVVIALPLGINYGKGVPLLSNPFEEKSLSQHISDTAVAASKKTKDMVEDAKNVIDDATKQ